MPSQSSIFREFAHLQYQFLFSQSEAETAKALVKLMRDAEGEYQAALSGDYLVMSDTTFKALRRVLPITRSKIDWNKITGYQIGQALKTETT